MTNPEYDEAKFVRLVSELIGVIIRSASQPEELEQKGERFARIVCSVAEQIDAYNREIAGVYHGES